MAPDDRTPRPAPRVASSDVAAREEVREAGDLAHLFALEDLPWTGPRRPAGATIRPVPEEPPGLAGRFAVLGAKLSVLLMLAWGLLFNFSEVRGSSMEPGIHDRDRIMVDHVSYLVSDVARGDVVVLRYPLDPSLDYIKRVIGLPGDEVVIARGEVRVNGERLDEPYVAESSIEPWTTMHATVRPGHYFVLGDNRRRSSDSREFGQVPFEYLRGKVRFRLWPPDRIGLVD